MTKTASKIMALVDGLRQRRYPTLLIVRSDSAPINSEELQAVADSCSLRYVNFRDDVLSAPGADIVLGAYLRGHFLEWLLSEAKSAGGILVDNADEVITTWRVGERRAFFLEFLRTESNCPGDPTIRAPVLLVSRLASRFALPTNEHGQGVVFDPLIDMGGHTA